MNDVAEKPLAIPVRRAPSAARAMMVRRAQSVLGLIGIVIVAILVSPRAADGSRIFLQSGNLTDVLRQVAPVGVIALAMTFVILSAGIDLSVGSILALSTCVLAKVLTEWTPANLSFTSHIALAVLAAIAAAGVIGAVNGLLISTLNVPPFIVTLAAMIGIRGLAKWLTTNATIDIGFGQDAAAAFARVVGSKQIMIGTFLALAAVLWVVLTRTVFGRYVRAVGDNE